MIFSFRSSSIKPIQNKEIIPEELDHDRLIDISLGKLSDLQCMGKIRQEKRIIFVLEVLQRALYSKSIKSNGPMSVADTVYFFEQEIYCAMTRSCVDRLPRLWIDLPGGMEKAREMKADNLPFRIKASFSKKK